jgi:hypothetical protein
MKVGPDVFILGVNEYDRAMNNLQMPGALSIADVELLHTRVIQSVAYTSTCDDVESKGLRNGANCDAETDEEDDVTPPHHRNPMCSVSIPPIVTRVGSSVGYPTYLVL